MSKRVTDPALGLLIVGLKVGTLNLGEISEAEDTSSYTCRCQVRWQEKWQMAADTALWGELGTVAKIGSSPVNDLHPRMQAQSGHILLTFQEKCKAQTLYEISVLNNN